MESRYTEMNRQFREFNLLVTEGDRLTEDPFRSNYNI